MKNKKTIKRILAVTDQDDLKEMIREVFDDPDSSYILLEATTGEEGIDRALEENPQIVLMDIGLHHLSGVDAARQIKKKIQAVKSL